MSPEPKHAREGRQVMAKAHIAFGKASSKK